MRAKPVLIISLQDIFVVALRMLIQGVIFRERELGLPVPFLASCGYASSPVPGKKPKLRGRIPRIQPGAGFHFFIFLIWARIRPPKAVSPD
jgi:hypothetical protein